MVNVIMLAALTTVEMPFSSSSEPDLFSCRTAGEIMFVHISVEQAGLSGLKEGQVVEYEPRTPINDGLFVRWGADDEAFTAFVA